MGNFKGIDLFEILAMLESPEEAEKFMTDLCTPSEIKSFIERWKVCQLLNEGSLSYREINKITGASLTTVGRVARFLRDEKYGGYERLLKKMEKKK